MITDTTDLITISHKHLKKLMVFTCVGVFFQTWCYTHTNGISLVRMANLLPQSDVATYEER